MKSLSVTVLLSVICVCGCYSFKTDTFGSRFVSSDPYYVIDLEGGVDASRYPVSSLPAIPEGGWSDEYKTTKIVLKCIEPGTFLMQGHVRTTISSPFYIGVFQITQRQYELVTGSKPSYFSNPTCYTKRPVDSVSWNMLRGDSTIYDWPNSKEIDPASFIGKIRAKTGLLIDLPTEAQWEYACKAGVNAPINRDVMYNIGRFYWNGGANSDSRDYAADRGTAVVGSYLPNAWGLYDMHGNLWEWCLDWHGRQLGGTDPVGVKSGTNRVVRGGAWSHVEHLCSAVFRGIAVPAENGNHRGVRICCAVGK